MHMAAAQIQGWWRKHTTIKKLIDLHGYLTASLTADILQDFVNKCAAISTYCRGDGNGLIGGMLIDMLLSECFAENLTQYKNYHTGESDMSICNMTLSQKKITGKSHIALDWSKNKQQSKRERFTCNILLVNLKTDQWWKHNPTTILSKLHIVYTTTIPTGIYIADKAFCKHYIKLTSNNKTNTLICQQYVYCMLNRSIAAHLYIRLPSPDKKLTFSIASAFSQQRLV